MKHAHWFGLALLVMVTVGMSTACGGGGGSAAVTSPTAPDLTPVSGEATEEVCHLAQLKIDVPLSKLEEHFAHGDWLIGPEICDGQDNDCDGLIDEGLRCDL